MSVWLEKPDGPGWWWHRRPGMLVVVVEVRTLGVVNGKAAWSSVQDAGLYPNRWTPLEEVTGLWQRVLPPKEDE